jgi:Uma2 family endonuclease
MFELREVIDRPLSAEELAMRYRTLSEDACLASVPGKLELDAWGRILMTPPSFYHGVLQGRLVRTLAALGGEAVTEAPIATPSGLFLADVAWASAQFMSAHGADFAPTRAPEICIQIVSLSNSVKELGEKRDAYFAAGAQEVWFVFPQSKRFAFYGPGGLLPKSAYPVDLGDVFH